MTANTKGEGGLDNTREDWTIRGARPNPKTGHHNTYHSRHSTGPQGKRQGGANMQTGDANIQRGCQQRDTPPFLTMPPHHPLCHPTIRDSPTHHHDEGGAHRGYPTTQTAQTHTHHLHTTHLARNSARHDSSTRQHRNGMSRARATPPHRAGQQQHTHRHSTHRGGWTPSTHPLIHSHSFMFAQPMIDNDQ